MIIIVIIITICMIIYNMYNVYIYYILYYVLCIIHVKKYLQMPSNLIIPSKKNGIHIKQSRYVKAGNSFTKNTGIFLPTSVLPVSPRLLSPAFVFLKYALKLRNKLRMDFIHLAKICRTKWSRSAFSCEFGKGTWGNFFVELPVAEYGEICFVSSSAFLILAHGEHWRCGVEFLLLSCLTSALLLSTGSVPSLVWHSNPYNLTKLSQYHE